jgi:hypothetical protein
MNLNHALVIGLFEIVSQLATEGCNQIKDGRENDALDQLANIERCTEWLRREFQLAYTKRRSKKDEEGTP